MDEGSIDLHDYRGRLLRLALAIVVGAALTALAMSGIRAFSGEPNKDPMGSSLIGLVAICIFVITAAVASRAIGAIASRRARR